MGWHHAKLRFPITEPSPSRKITSRNAMVQKAIIIGAGPAGLTAAYELLTRTGIRPIVLEKEACVGGISRTVNYKGNRIDIGGHRFFSKSDRVMEWWLKMMPLEAGQGPATISSAETAPGVIDPLSASDPDAVMLLRPRKSRIYYLRRFFDYPISLSRTTLLNLGFARTMRIGFSYLHSTLRSHKRETNLEQFLINRFGRELYLTFFKSYTEKVWGVPCEHISAEWGAQRIKGVSIRSSLMHAFHNWFPKNGEDLAQKEVETSLIEQFLYPKYGPGQMWEKTAGLIHQLGGEVRLRHRVGRIFTDSWKVRAVEVTNCETGVQQVLEGDYFFSTEPVQELIREFDVPPPKNVFEVSEGLVYRDFVTVGLLVRSLRIREDGTDGGLVRDNWIYIQEPNVRLGRLQIFNNWSPHMVANEGTIWLGLEYFCNQYDDLWNLSDNSMVALAIAELSKIGIIDATDVFDSTVLRIEKTYPAYFGTFDRFAEIREHLDRYENLFLIGRNGMHRYNNQDHSMLTAMIAVDNIVAGKTDKAALWDVNTESEYHEESAK